MAVQEDLKSALERCNGTYKPIHQFWHIYAFNTENIKGYIEHLDINNKSVLTVGSSGEQVINAQICGAKTITLYDVNNFAGYYTWLKIAGIMALSYDDYLRFFFVSPKSKSIGNLYRFNRRIFNEFAPVLKSLDYDSYYFWNELLANIRSRGRIETILKDKEVRSRVIKGYSLYLDSEENYNKAKKAVKDICFKYIVGNLLTDKVEGSYDNIILSNISSYINPDELLNLIRKLDSNLNHDGRMLFAYLYDADFHLDGNMGDQPKIYDMDFVKEYFKYYLSEHYAFPNSRKIVWPDDDNFDLALVYHKK